MYFIFPNKQAWNIEEGTYKNLGCVMRESKVTDKNYLLS